MSVPSAEQFSGLILLLRKPLAVPIDCLERIEDDQLFSPGQVKGFFVAAAANYQTRASEIRDSPVWKWLDSSREYDRAYGLVNGLSKKKQQLTFNSSRVVQVPDLDQTVGHHFDHLAKVQEAETDKRKIVDFQIRILSRWLIPPGSQWIIDSVLALAEYFEGSTSKQMVEFSRKHKRAASALEKSIFDYLAVIGSINAMHKFEILGRSILLAKKTQHQITTDTLKIAEMPITRIDDTSDERLFVYRMNSANRRHNGTPKTEAIVCLMNMEGFRHQYDKRTIEKLCADFTGTKEALKARNAPGQPG